MSERLEFLLRKHQPSFFDIVKNEDGRFHAMDFSITNTDVTEELIADTGNFSRYVTAQLTNANVMFGIGGYNENRVLYKRSKLFSGVKERSLHLGLDIWGPAGTPVHAPLSGRVHSYAFNNNFGDYGATIILQHQLEDIAFHTLYGHLALADLVDTRVGKYITGSEKFATFGPTAENGNWPPHLHFQIIEDIGLYEGDYPGVCNVKEAPKFLRNSPDPSLMLNFPRK